MSLPVVLMSLSWFESLTSLLCVGFIVWTHFHCSSLYTTFSQSDTAWIVRFLLACFSVFLLCNHLQIKCLKCLSTNWCQKLFLELRVLFWLFYFCFVGARTNYTQIIFLAPAWWLYFTMRLGAHCYEPFTPLLTALHTHCWRRLSWWTMPAREVNSYRLQIISPLPPHFEA